MLSRITGLLLALIAAPAFAAPVGTSFTYQGELRNSTTHAPVADGPYDFEFHLFDADTLGNDLAQQSKNDVAVTGGLFSLELDYTDVPFAASQAYWLEVHVRPGAEAGGFQQMLPRQRITPTPYAINTRGVQDGGVGTAALASGAVTADKIGTLQVGAPQLAADAVGTTKLADDAVTAAKILDGAIASADIADGSIASADIDATQVQRRVAACGVNSAIQAVADDGTVTCLSAGVGTVSSIDTGAGLTGGPITNAGTISIADDGVTATKIAEGAVGSSEIVDESVASVDVLDGAISANDLADNSVASGEVVDNSLAAIDLATGSVGSDEIGDGTVASADIADNSIGTLDIGNGSIASVDIQDSSIAANDVNSASVQWRVSQSCSGAIRQINADGTVVCNAAAASIVRPVQPATAPTIPVGGASSVTIGIDGLPLISVHDVATGNLLVVHCENPACSPMPAATTIDSAANDVGAFNSIGIGANGFGVVAYYDATAGDLKLAQCADIACTSASVQTIDATDDVGKFAALGFDASNRAVIAYFDETNDNLKFAECNNAGCTAPVVGVAHASGNDVGRGISLFVSNSTALIAHADATAGQLKLARCFVGSSCTNATATILDLDTTSGPVAVTAMTVLARGAPAFFYQRGNDLYVVRCIFRTCNTMDAPAFVAGSFLVPLTHLAATTDALGRPHIITVAGDNLQTYRCFEEGCDGTPIIANAILYSSAPGGLDARPSMALGHHGFPVLTTRNGATTRVYVCDNHLCTFGSRLR